MLSDTEELLSALLLLFVSRTQTLAEGWLAEHRHWQRGGWQNTDTGRGVVGRTQTLAEGWLAGKNEMGK